MISAMAAFAELRLHYGLLLNRERGRLLPVSNQILAMLIKKFGDSFPEEKNKAEDVVFVKSRLMSMVTGDLHLFGYNAFLDELILFHARK